MVARGTWAAVEGFESHIFYHVLQEDIIADKKLFNHLGGL